LASGVEPNPGPPTGKHSEKLQNEGDKNEAQKILNILSINVNGMGNHHKNKILMQILNNEIKKCDDTICFLQETHSKFSDKIFTYSWRGLTINHPGSGASGGVAILTSRTYNIVEKYEHPEGRYLVAIVKNKVSEEQLILCNVYGPNNQNEKLTFFRELFDALIAIQIKFKEASTIIAGDFNCYLEAEDSTRIHGSPSLIQEIVHGKSHHKGPSQQ
jgi:exonuclease III